MYGATFGLASKLTFRREIFKIQKFSGKIVLGNIAYGTVGSASFNALFNTTNWFLIERFPDDELRPFIKGASCFISCFIPALYDSRSIRTAA